MLGLIDALHTSSPVSGLTHNFYRYPGRMSPQLARAVIQQFTEKNDYVLDPFMGGGTTIVEALASGRQAVGVDLNSIATFVSTAKTTPLSHNDFLAIRRWLNQVHLSYQPHDAYSPVDDPRIKNLPDEIQGALSSTFGGLDTLPFIRQRRFVRCVLLRLGQWAVDCKSQLPNEEQMRDNLQIFADEMLHWLNDFTNVVRANGIMKRNITQRRLLLHRSSVGLDKAPEIQRIKERPRLVLTSPPYPGVRMLYHRWQVGGRRATPAPYWIINSNDGQYEPYYTMGGTSLSGQQTYFRLLKDIFSAVRSLVAPDALVVQLISFSDVETQLPAFHRAMEEAGYYKEVPIGLNEDSLWRRIPNRKWYNRINIDRGAGRELLLFYRPQ